MNSLFFTDIPEPDETFVSSLKERLFKQNRQMPWWKYSLLFGLFAVSIAILSLQYFNQGPNILPKFDAVQALEGITATVRKYSDPTKLIYSKVRVAEFNEQGFEKSAYTLEGWQISCGASGSVGVTTYSDYKVYTYGNDFQYISYDTKKKKVENLIELPILPEYVTSDAENPYCYTYEGTIDWYKNNQYPSDVEPKVSVATKHGKEVVQLEIVYKNEAEVHKDTLIRYYYLSDSYIPYLTEYYDHKGEQYILYSSKTFESFDIVEPTSESLERVLSFKNFFPTIPAGTPIYEQEDSMNSTGWVKVSKLKVIPVEYKYDFTPISPAPTNATDTYRYEQK